MLLVPGELDTPTGGYAYDRRLVSELARLGWRVRVRSLHASFPHPTRAALRQASVTLTGLPQGTQVLIDGLALGAMPRIVEAHATRLRMLALIHHPLAAESGLAARVARRLRSSERCALRAMCHVVVTSRATARALRRYGVHPSRLTVIEPGTDLPPRRPPRAAGRTPGAPLRLLCVAALVPRKGHDLLLSALARLSELSWHLTCVGSLTRDRRAVARLRAQARRLGLADRLTLTGAVDRAALARLYANADLFVLATRHEGYGMAVAEALGYGLPVVATRTGAIPELIGSGAGCLVRSDDPQALARALARVGGDARTRARLRAGALSARRTLPSWRRQGRAWSALLDRIRSTDVAG